MNEEFGFTLHRRGTHRLTGRTVLQIVASLEPADADRSTIEIAGTLADAGARALVAAPAGRLVSELQAKGGVWIDFPSQAKNPVAMMINIRRLKALIVREQVDLIHVRSRPAGWVAFLATRSTKTPLVTSLSQISPGRSIVKQRYNSVMAKGDTVIAGSRFAAATISSIYPTALGRVTLVRPGVDLKPFTASSIDPARVQSLRTAWQIAPDERIIMLVGRPSVSKGYKVVIEATRRLLERGITDIKLVFIGDEKASSGKDIDQAAKASGLVGRIHKVEACADMPAALLAAAVVVVPPIGPEGFGRIAVEAQALGTPVIVSDLGAVPETVLAPPDVDVGRRTGWRVSPSDSELLSDAIRDVLALGASSRDALAARARKQVEERFAVDRMTFETLDAYTTLLDRRAAVV